ncbi:hypothetical protein [Methanofollis ethanolicus]|uniref:hypothetical protein n=1 Tax=Methanofollis ethanolicus TaxID=488124 RepID=UPI00083313D7|nr:hypothetical protein [Methanofollis ethanolicus]
MPLTLFDAMRPADRDRLADPERRAAACEREAAPFIAEARACWKEAQRIRRYYEQMTAVFGLKECVAHVRRGARTEIIEVP